MKISLQIIERLDASWNDLVASMPGAHVLQSAQWGMVKRKYGWSPHPLVWREEGGEVVAAALVLSRQVSLPGLAPLKVMYAPKGPLMDWGDVELHRAVLTQLTEFARQKGALFLKIDPDVLLGKGVPGEKSEVEDVSGVAVLKTLSSSGWRFSPEQIQFRNTIWVDLSPSEESLLANMKQKTRYNVRLAERKGVQVIRGEERDLETLFEMYAQTSLRDGFAIRDRDYYLTVWGQFMRAGMAEPLLANVEGELVAAIMLFYFAGRAWYLYGMSRTVHREKMPNYLLQWEAIRRAKERGCEIYDLWGAPDKFSAEDRMWGVYRFKRGLGGEVIRTIGAWDFAFKPALYWVYSRVLPQVMNVWRKIGVSRTRNQVPDGV